MTIKTAAAGMHHILKTNDQQSPHEQKVVKPTVCS